MKAYVAERCFGGPVNVDELRVREWLRDPTIQEAISGYLSALVSKLTVEQRELEFENADFRLSKTIPFTWRRKHAMCRHTVFNYVATFNDFETRFAEFLDGAADVDRFAALGTTEQGASTRFRVDYIKPTGAIGFYYPDWVAAQSKDDGEVMWIVETKGRVWKGTEAKDSAIREWCRTVGEQTQVVWRFVRVNQPVFERAKAHTLGELLGAIEAEENQARVTLIVS